MGIEFFVSLSSTNVAMHLTFKQRQHNHDECLLLHHWYMDQNVGLPIPFLKTPTCLLVHWHMGVGTAMHMASRPCPISLTLLGL